jgi:hypothetical protein
MKRYNQNKFQTHGSIRPIGTWASSLDKANGACSWPLTCTKAVIPPLVMRLHGLVLDSEGGHIYLYLLQISVSVTFNAHVRMDASLHLEARIGVKGGGAVESWMVSMLEKTQLWPNRSCSVVDPPTTARGQGVRRGREICYCCFLRRNLLSTVTAAYLHHTGQQHLAKRCKSSCE